MTAQVRALIMKPVVFIGVIDNGTVANRTQSSSWRKAKPVECVSEQAATAVVPVRCAGNQADAAAGAKFHHARRGAAAGMEDLDLGA